MKREGRRSERVRGRYLVAVLELLVERWVGELSSALMEDRASGRGLRVGIGDGGAGWEVCVKA